MYTGSTEYVITHRCTSALEMAAILLDIEAGDSSIIHIPFNIQCCCPSWIYTGVLRHLQENFEYRPGKKIEEAVTPHTKAIFVVHYAGIICDMERKHYSRGVPADLGRRPLSHYSDFSELFIQNMKKLRITTPFHYVPLHSSPAWIRYGRVSGNMDVTNDISVRLVRLPMFAGVEAEQDQVIASILETLDVIFFDNQISFDFRAEAPV